MGDRTIIASRLDDTNKSLEEFDQALLFAKRRKAVDEGADERQMVQKLLTVLEPLAKYISKGLSDSAIISEYRIVRILMARHSREWPAYGQKIVQVFQKLSSKGFPLSVDDLGTLDEIADALDAECANLFLRMSEGR